MDERSSVSFTQFAGAMPSPPPPPPPPPRPFVSLRDGLTDAATGCIIRVVSYNILAEAYAPTSSFPDTHADHLAWAARSPRLLAEILAYGADVLCLQEVQEEVWESEDASSLIPSLRAAGYEGAWFWGEGGTSIKPKPPLVGPALLWRTARFAAVTTAAIAFRDAACADALAGGHDGTAALLAGSRDGAVAALLRQVGGDEAADPTTPTILAVSAHLNWDPRTPDLKVLQAAALCDELARLGGGGETESPLPPLVLGGDLNSPALDSADNAAPGAPSCEGEPAGAVVLLSTGACPPGHPHHPARQRGGVPAPLTTGPWGPLTSVRAAAGGEPSLTTRRSAGFEATLDYIFVSAQHWRVRAVLADPWWEEAGQGEGGGGGGRGDLAPNPPPPAPPAESFSALPNADWPSDHLAVGAVLELVDVEKK
jgi:CCR4-NOT transcription complex subunit 6